MEQKRAAIETCIRFDHSSADTIAELGYPSRTMLKDVVEGIREDGEGSGKGTAHPCIQRRAHALGRLAPQHLCQAHVGVGEAHGEVSPPLDVTPFTLKSTWHLPGSHSRGGLAF